MDYKYIPTDNIDLLDKIKSLMSELEDTKLELEKYKELVIKIKADCFTLFCEIVKKEVLI